MKRLFIFLFCAAVLILVVYQVVIYYDNNFKYGRMRMTPGVRAYEQPLQIMETGIVPVAGGEAELRAADGSTLKSPLNLNSTRVIETGKIDYQNYCAQCHGVNFDGNGTVGQSFAPLPTDLRSPRVQAQSEGVLFQHISYGIGGGGRQPALCTTIRIPNRWGIVAFVKSLGPRP
jgi:mono/diheme cytochrome c family protein